jgi:hypothetical protein
MQPYQDAVNQERLQNIKVQLNELRENIDTYKANIQSTVYLINVFKRFATLDNTTKTDTTSNLIKIAPTIGGYKSIGNNVSAL